MDPTVETALRNLLVAFAARGFVPEKAEAFAEALADVDLTGNPAAILSAINDAQIANTDPLP